MSAMATRHQSGVGDVLSRSSSANLSSPPPSTPEPGSPSAQFATEFPTHRNSSIIVNRSDVPAAAQPPARKKPGRKPKISLPENGSSATNTDAPKAKRTRKPRDPNAPPAQRKRKTPASSENTTLKVIADPERLPSPTPKFTEQKLVSRDLEVRPDSQSRPPSQNGKHEDIPNQRSIQSFFNAPPPPPQQQQPAPSQPQHSPLPIQQQPVRTSGQNYDPIRSNYDPVRETVVNHHSFSNSQGSPNHPPPSMNRASASPSISSLVDPPNQAMTSPSIATQSFFHQQQQARYRDDSRTSVPPSPTTNRLAPSVAMESNSKPSAPLSTFPNPPGQLAVSRTQSPAITNSALPNAPSQSQSAMTSENNLTMPGPTTSKKTNGSATTSAAASPKPFSKSKDKDIFPAPPPLPGAMGAGLNDGTEFRAPTVVLNIPLSGETNKYINFTKLAEEQYGWDALHPRLAAQRDRLARVAAAGAALERNASNRESGDEMSLDSEGEGSNAEMGGMSDGRTGTDGGTKKVVRKRKMKEDEYDKDDGFVDDSELLWEEQAAAANDGFFVYSGPLVPEVPKPATELRADGAPKRGRGRGSRGGATRSTGTRGGLGGPGSRGGALTGPGSRGGSTTRKPRITKADRARMEQEKLEREKMGTMASMPGNYGGGMPQLASAANLGNTPMVFNQ